MFSLGCKKYLRTASLIVAATVLFTSFSAGIFADAAPDENGTLASDSGVVDSGKKDRAAVAAMPKMVGSVADLDFWFPDDAFAQVIWDQIPAVQGKKGEEIEGILGSYEGNINAVEKQISDCKGLNLLTKADTVDLRRNRIGDWTRLSESGNFSDDHYGTDSKNVTWKVSGNWFGQLPVNFGGRLMIEQAASTSTLYKDLPKQIYVREEGAETFGTDLNIARCRILGTSADNSYIENGWVHIISASTAPSSSIRPAVKLVDNKTATVSGIDRSGRVMYAIGVDEVIRFKTTDELGTITPGSVSFKYYIPQNYEVYDYVNMTSNGFVGAVDFTKYAEDGKTPLSGAVYELYNNRNELKGTYTTGADGKIPAIGGLTDGGYYFKEKTAPAGYDVNPERVAFSFTGETKLAGGLASVEMADGSTINAGEGHVMISPDSPDVKLNITNPEVLSKVEVTYSSLNGGGGRTDTFTNTAADKTASTRAMAALNKQRTDKNIPITGPVTVHIEFSHNVTEEKTIAVSQTDKLTPPPPEVPPEPEVPEEPDDPEYPVEPETPEVTPEPPKPSTPSGGGGGGGENPPDSPKLKPRDDPKKPDEPKKPTEPGDPGTPPATPPVETPPDTPVTGTVEVPPEGIVTVEHPPEHGTVTVNPKTGEWEYTPKHGYEGPDTFTVTVTENGKSKQYTINVQVLAGHIGEKANPSTGR